MVGALPTRHRVDRTYMRFTPVRAAPSGARPEPDRGGRPLRPGQPSRPPRRDAVRSARCRRDLLRPHPVRRSLRPHPLRIRRSARRARADPCRHPGHADLARSALGLPPARRTMPTCRKTPPASSAASASRSRWKRASSRSSRPIDDTPAAKAGVLANDYIVELDGKPGLRHDARPGGRQDARPDRQQDQDHRRPRGRRPAARFRAGARRHRDARRALEHGGRRRRDAPHPLLRAGLCRHPEGHRGHLRGSATASPPRA